MGILDQSTQTPDPHDGSRDMEDTHRRIEAAFALQEDDETKRLNAEVPVDMYERFKAKCEREDRSMSEVIRAFVAYYSED